MDIKVKVNPSFLPYLQRDDRIQVHYGGAGSGKSRYVAQKLTLMLLKEKRVLLCVRNVFATLRNSCYEEFKTVFDSMGITPLIRFRETDLTILFPNGSKIIMKGADSEEKLLSIANVSDVWCEEAYEIPREIITQLFLRVRRNDLQCHFFFTFNPISKASYMYEFIHDEKTLADGFVHKSTYLDNKFLSEEYKEQLEDLKRTNYPKYQVYCLGEFGVLGKTIFEGNWKVDPTLDVNKLYAMNLEERIGIDFGWNDPTTCITSLVDTKNKRLYIVDELYQSELLLDDLAKVLLNKGMQYKTIYCDSAEPRSIKMLQNAGLKRATGAKKGKDSIMAGIDLLQTYQIIIAGHCKHVAEEFANYTWKKNKQTGEYLDEPLDNGFCHCIDAIRYSMSPYLEGINKVKTLSKGILGI